MKKLLKFPALLLALMLIVSSCGERNAEHGIDSQVILVSTDENTLLETETQLQQENWLLDRQSSIVKAKNDAKNLMDYYKEAVELSVSLQINAGLVKSSLNILYDYENLLKKMKKDEVLALKIIKLLEYYVKDEEKFDDFHQRFFNPLTNPSILAILQGDWEEESFRPEYQSRYLEHAEWINQMEFRDISRNIKAMKNNLKIMQQQIADTGVTIDSLRKN